MAEPDWAVVLGHLYHHTGEVTVEADVEIDRGEFGPEYSDIESQREALFDELSVRTGVDRDDIGDILDHMGTVNLVHRTTSDTGASVSLTKPGFDVAHEREINARQERLNRVLAILTAGLLFGAVAQAMGAYFNTPMDERTAMAAGMVGLGVAIVFIIGALLWEQ